MVSLPVKEIQEHVVPKVKWYLKYRTQIWSTVFGIVGVLGGSIATIQAYVPTLKYDTVVIEQKLQKLDEIASTVVQIQKTLDDLKK
jgi:hypothetical protein